MQIILLKTLWQVLAVDKYYQENLSMYKGLIVSSSIYNPDFYIFKMKNKLKI